MASRKSKRKIRGTRVKPSVKSFSCTNCGSPVKVEVVGHTLNVVCPSCYSIIDAKDPNYQIIQKSTQGRRERPYIPIGSKGKLKGKKWQCTGFMVKSDSGYYWREYLLYNPYHGYRWLVEVDGHWVLYKRIYRAVNGHSEAATYKGKNFKKFNDGRATIRYVEGEFYWRVKAGDSARVADYIAPPEALSVEYGEHEEIWSLGYSIAGETLMKAFRLKRYPPQAVGIGMVQPSPIKEQLQASMKPMTNALLALLAIFVLRGVTASNKVVFSERFPITEIQQTREPIKTREFDITGGTTNLQLDGFADLRNSWLYIDGLLVDSDTQKGLPLPLEISFYRGSDWKEGSKRNDRVINNVPPGRYYLSMNFKLGPRPPQGFLELMVRRDVPINSNFILACVLILIAPFLNFFRSRGFEVSRWSNSDYSPYSVE